MPPPESPTEPAELSKSPATSSLSVPSSPPSRGLFWEASYVLGLGLATTLVSLHGQPPVGLAQAALMALAVPIDSTRLFRGPELPRPIDLLRLAVVATSTSLLVWAGALPPSFVVEALMAIAVPGDPTRWQRKGGPTP